MRQAISRRAEEIYIRNGKVPGHDLENWIQAEGEILRESVEGSTPKNSIIIKVAGVQYVGEYDAESSGGYVPGEFSAGDPISVRFEGDKMFVQRANHTELETTVVKKMTARS
jgi:hypothetical protein